MTHFRFTVSRRIAEHRNHREGRSRETEYQQEGEAIVRSTGSQPQVGSSSKNASPSEIVWKRIFRGRAAVLVSRYDFAKSPRNQKKRTILPLLTWTKYPLF